MGQTRINPRLAKRHRTYSIEELARLFGVHKQTVRGWMNAGLAPIDDRRPILFRGDEVQVFHQRRRAKRRVKCRPGELYCVPCRVARRPDGDLADCVRLKGEVGDLRGLCPDCGRLMHRRVNMTRLAAAAGSLQVRVTQGAPHLAETTDPTVNCHFKDEPEDR